VILIPTHWSSSAPQAIWPTRNFPGAASHAKRVTSTCQSSVWPRLVESGPVSSAAHDSLEKHGGIDARLSRDWTVCCVMWTATTKTRPPIKAIRKELKGAQSASTLPGHPAPVFGTVGTGSEVGLRQSAREIVEKPFGNDTRLSPGAQPDPACSISESAMLPHRPYLGKRPVNNVSFPIANAFMEPFWNRNYIERCRNHHGGRIRRARTRRLIRSNWRHPRRDPKPFFQILCNLAMEPPVALDSETIRDGR